MDVPVAAITGTRAERFKAWLVRLFAAPNLLARSSAGDASWWWSTTGSMAAGFALSALVLLKFDALMNVNLALSLGWAVFVVLAVPIFILPFLISYSLVLHVRLTSRYAGAAYGAVFHVLAHWGVLYALGAPWLALPLLPAPVLVGALWGSWLPASLAKPI